MAIRCTVHDTAAWLVIWYRLEWLFWDERLHTYIYRRVNTQRYQARLSCMLYPYSKCHFEHTHRRHIYIYIYIYVYTHMHCRQTVEAKKWVSTPLDAMWGVRRSSPDVHVLFNGFKHQAAQNFADTTAFLSMTARSSRLYSYRKRRSISVNVLRVLRDSCGRRRTNMLMSSFRLQTCRKTRPRTVFLVYIYIDDIYAV